jgi:hypothetical protein
MTDRGEGDRARRLAASLPEEPESWSIPRQLVEARGVFHLPGCTILGSGGKWLSAPLAELPPNAGLCATCIAPGLDDREHEFVEWRTLYQPLYLAAADIAVQLDEDRLDLPSIARLLRGWGSAEAEFMRRNPPPKPPTFHGASVHLACFVDWDDDRDDAAAEAAGDPYSLTRRVQGYPIDHFAAAPVPILDACRSLLGDVHAAAKETWSEDDAAVSATRLLAFDDANLVGAGSKREWNKAQRTREQVRERIRTGASLEEIATAAPDLLDAAGTWARRILDGDDRAPAPYVRPVVQVTYPGQRGSLDRVVDQPLTHDEAYARRRSATALNQLFLGYTLVTATAYTLEHRVVSLRSWDHGKTWIEPPSDDWAPPKRRGLVFETLDSPVYTLVLHGVGRGAPMRAVDLGAPSDFYLLSTLRNGPWAPESGEARSRYGEDWQPE